MTVEAVAIVCRNFKNKSLSCLLDEMFLPLTVASFLLGKTLVSESGISLV